MNKVQRYFFPVHLDGGNRGCEGIAKGTAQILNLSKDHLIGLCTNMDLDKRLGVDEFVTLVPSRVPSILDKIMFHIYPRVWSKEKVSIFYDKYWYDSFIEGIDESDVMMVTGGDMLCYEDNFINYITDKLYKKGTKCILWGASMGPENMTPQKKETLQRFDLIYARESLSRDYFQSLGLRNVICYPDPAFVLEPQRTDLPEVFEREDVIGLNLSNFVLGGYTLETPFGEQVKKLIDYIMEKTNLHIMLIPHVLWRGQDDKKVAQNIKHNFGKSDRISILNSDDLNYCQIRYVISHCRFFIGARTHSVISAYSTRVPTLALGYSIKSRGIAKDLGINESLVVNCKNPKSNELLDSFIYLRRNEKEIRSYLNNRMDHYKNEVLRLTNELDCLL